MKTMPILISLSLGWAAAAGPVAAAPETPLSEDSVTEQTIIDALTSPVARESADGEVPSRGFELANPGGAAASRAAVRRSAVGQRASVLVTFVADSADLTASARAALQVVAKAFNSPQLARTTFIVEGHADPRGSNQYNLRLSEARAKSVVSYLVRTQGISRERLAPIGMGSAHLLNADNPVAAENRRVTFVTR